MNRVEKLLTFLNDSPQDSFLKHALALEYVKLGNDAEAKTLFESVIATDPAYVGTYYHLAKLLERQGLNTEAVRVYGQGIKECQAKGERHALNELRAALEELEN
jgi:Tfp pilus assembly protein PilF